MSGRPIVHVRDFQRATLKPRHRAVVAALGEAYFSEGDPFSSERREAMADDVDGAVSNASKTLRFGLTLMLDALRFAPVFLLRKLTAFEDLSLSDRSEVLRRMEHSRFAPWTIIFVAYKTLMTMIFFEDEAVLRDAGYPGPERHLYKLGPRPADAREALREEA